MTDGGLRGGPSSPEAVPWAGGDPDPSRTGPVWEQPGASWPIRFAQTVQAVLTGPGAFFRTMRRDAGPGGVAGSVYQLLLSTLVAGMHGPAAAREQALMGAFSTGCFVVVMPLVAVFGMFAGSAIYHVMLLLLGGARRSYETTLRVSAYASGATSVLGLIPFCGALIGGIYAVVVAIIGLSRAHEISTGKAAAAVLLPVVLCCGLVLLLYGAIAALVFGALWSGAHQS